MVGITRPYVGQNARSFDGVQQAGQKKGSDVTSPPKPEVRRAWAFERAADGSAAAPPPPRNAPGRDPLVIELGQIEVGTRIELLSLSDDPSAEFSSRCKDTIFELPLTGYDVAGRVGTIALDEKAMKEKGISPGERFLVRQVDEDGNASLPVHLHLDPRGWARGAQLDEPTADGGTQRVAGRAIDIAVGVHGLPGEPNPGRMEQVLGKATMDQRAPVLVDKNVSVVTEKLDARDQELLTKYSAAMTTLIGGATKTRADIKAQLDANPSWATTPQYAAHVEVLRDLIGDGDDSATFAKLSRLTHAAAGTSANDSIEWNQVNAMATDPPSSITLVRFDNAAEPGVTLTVQNSRSGESRSVTQGELSRSAAVALHDVQNGDPLIVTYHDNPPDQQANHGTPFGFRYDAKAKDGKARSNPLDIRLGAFSLDTKAKATQDG